MVRDSAQPESGCCHLIVCMSATHGERCKENLMIAPRGVVREPSREKLEFSQASPFEVPKGPCRLILQPKAASFSP